MKAKLFLVIAVAAILIFAAFRVGLIIEKMSAPAPAPTPASTTSHGGPVRDYISLVDKLSAADANVQPAGEISQPFFSVKGLVIAIDGSDVQVFEYADEDAVDAEAALVSPDGGSIGTTMVSWMASPHFYKVERLIVLYVGENEATIDILESVLGPQFAGR